MMYRLLRTFWIIAAVAAPASATVVIAQTLDEMSRAAPAIVRGSVGQVQARWNEGYGRIFTYAEVRVSQSIKGSLKGSILVRQPGGVVGAMGQRVAGAAQFTEGEEVLLFLEPAADEPDTYLVWSLAAGKVSLRANALGEVRAVRDLRGLAFYQQSGTRPDVRSLDRLDDLGSPQQVIRRVEAALKTGATPPEQNSPQGTAR